MPKISVIVPVFNKKKYLGQLAECLRAQFFDDYECLLIDDGSTDGSAEVCDAMAAADDRIQVFHMPNGGVSRARNIGLKCTKGEYVTFIDADDGFSKDYLSNLYQCMEKSQADMVIGSLKKVWEHTEKEESCIVPVQGLMRMEDILPQFATWQKESGIFGFCCGKLVRRELLNGLAFEPGVRLAEDFQFYLKVYPRIKSIYFDSKPNYYYLQAAGNSSVLVNDDQIDYMTQLRINLEYKSFLKKQQVLCGENEKIVDQLLANYMFFVLFYGELDGFQERFDKVYSIYREDNSSLNGQSAFSRWMLFLLRHKAVMTAKNSLRCYRWARKMMRGR